MTPMRLMPSATPLAAAAVLFTMIAAPAIAHDHGGRGAHMLERADTDNDGAISRAEAVAARAATFQRLDANADGAIDLATEMRRHRGRGGAEGGPAPGADARSEGRPEARNQARGAPLDANADGRVSRDEFMARLPMFDRLDADRDGRVTRAELIAARQARGDGPR
jgi:hypothetical protein